MGVTKITCYGGVAQIGGNKILVEDRDARIWLDMGATFGFGSEFFVEYLTARKRFGLRDYDPAAGRCCVRITTTPG